MPALPPPRHTRQRAAVADVLAATTEFRTAQQVHEQLAASGAKVSLATVYRNLQAMVDAGQLDSVRTPEGLAAYRVCGRDAHHHHLVCRTCGKAVELELSGFEDAVGALAQRHGFVDVSHEVEIFGLCAECAAQRSSATQQPSGTRRPVDAEHPSGA